MPNESSDDSDSQNSEFADFLAAYDEALATGRPLPDTTRLNAEQQQRLHRLAGLLHRLPLPVPARASASQESASSVWSSAATVDTGGPKTSLEIESLVVNDESDLSLPSVPGYRVLREVGRGGMGVVFQARHLALNRIVALKMILDANLANAERLHRFQLEAELAARILHPNVVAVYEVGTAQNRPFLALEWVEGGSLAQKLRTDGLFSPRKAAELVQVLARAVHAAHAEGVIHRDLKPGNVLLSAQPAGDVPKIADFGLAKPITRDHALTTTGAIVGTPEYMAPEQAGADGAPVGPGCDIYALGVILYELLTGRPPFRADSLVMTLHLVMKVEPVAPRSLNPGVPRDLETICLKCLEKDPVRRYESASALADDLSRFVNGEPIKARPVSVVNRAWRLARRHVGYSLLGGLAVALLLTLVVGSVAFALTEARLRRDIVDRETRAEAARDAARKRFFETVRTLNPVTRTGFATLDTQSDRRNSFLMQAELCEAYLQGLPAGREKTPRDLNVIVYLATIRAELGDHEAAEKLYDMGIAQAEQLYKARPADENVTSLLSFGYLSKGTYLKKSLRLPEAMDNFARSRTYGRDWLASSGENADAVNHFLAATTRLQDVQYELRQTDDAIKTLTELISDCRRLCPPRLDHPANAIELSEVLRRLGVVLDEVGRTQEAIAPVTEALELLAPLDKDQQNLEARIQYNSNLLLRAAMYERLGRLDEAETDRKRLSLGAGELQRLRPSL